MSVHLQGGFTIDKGNRQPRVCKPENSLTMLNSVHILGKSIVITKHKWWMMNELHEI